MIFQIFWEDKEFIEVNKIIEIFHMGGALLHESQGTQTGFLA